MFIPIMLFLASLLGQVREAEPPPPPPQVASIVIDESDNTLTAYDAGGSVILSGPVALGKAGWRTPQGSFVVEHQLDTTPWPSYGPVAIVISAKGRVEFPFDGTIAIHGTNRPGLLGRDVSHGCIRIANDHVLALSALTPDGTPVTIQP